MAFYETLKLEKGMYSAPGKSFTQTLEELDSSENYRGTAGCLSETAKALPDPR